MHFGYPMVLSLLYALAGPSILSGKLLNAFFGALIGPLVFFLFEELSGSEAHRRHAATAAWVVALFPYDIAWGGFLLKDTILEFLFAVAMLCSVVFLKRQSVSSLAGALLAIAAASTFRIFALGVWAGALTLAALAYGAGKIAATHFKRWLLFVGATAVLIGVAVAWLILSDAGATWLALLSSFQDLPDIVPITGTFSGVAAVARAAFAFFFSPFPWVFWQPDAIDYLFYPGMLVIYAGFPFFAAGMWYLTRDVDPVSVFVVAPIVIWGAAQIIVFVSQAGGREKVMIDFLFIICAVWAWPRRRRLIVTPAYAALAAVALGHTLLYALR